MLSAFRPDFGCQTALLKIVEDWKRALDDNKYIAAISMDLSKAFDCLPHNLLLLKLEAYGLTISKIIKKLLRRKRAEGEGGGGGGGGGVLIVSGVNFSKVCHRTLF